MQTGIAADPAVRKHDPGPGYPEQPSRYTAVMDRLESGGLLGKVTHLPLRSANDDELSLVHTGRYIELVEREVAQNRRQLSTGDTAISAAFA